MHRLKVKKPSQSGFVLFALALSTLAAGSCSLDSSDDTGAIALTIESPLALTIVPNFDMAPTSYLVKGTGPGGQTFSVTTKSTSYLQSDVKTGAWTVTVSALNAEGNTIGQGSGSASVPGPGQTAPLAVIISPLSGNGSVSVTITWNASNVPSASVTGQLLAPTGSAIPLTISMGSGTATAFASVPAGYYTMVLQLLLGGSDVAGAVDVARIIQGQTTSGSYNFTQTTGTGSLSVGINTASASSLAVTLSGQTSTLSAGSNMTVSASVSGYNGNVTYAWYLNGQSVATGPSLTIGSSLTAGLSYRLDVAAFSANESQAGSATCAFTVQ